MSIPWIIEDCNLSKPTGIYSGVTAINPSQNESNLIWHAWDFTLALGTYTVSRVSYSGSGVSYFAVGPIDYKFQPAPITPQRRFGEIFNPWPGFHFVTRPDAGYILTVPTFIRFDIVDVKQYIRIESWARLEQFNNSPFPVGLSSWRDFEPRIVTRPPGPGEPGEDILVNVDGMSDFGSDFASFNRRSDIYTPYFHILFGAENGGGGIYTNLVIQLTKIA